MDPEQQMLADQMVGAPDREQHFRDADEALGLTPEEAHLYRRHLDTLWSDKGVSHPDGSHSSLLQMNVEHNGRHYNIPSVREGRILTGDEAVGSALAEGIHKYPSYDSPDEAESRYMDMHHFMDRDTQDYLNASR